MQSEKAVSFKLTLNPKTLNPKPLGLGALVPAGAAAALGPEPCTPELSKKQTSSRHSHKTLLQALNPKVPKPQNLAAPKPEKKGLKP